MSTKRRSDSENSETLNGKKGHLSEFSGKLGVSRIFAETHPGTLGHPQQPGLWPARWISVESERRKAFVGAYRLQFTLPRGMRLRLHVSGDERYELFIDGERASCGPERGDSGIWFFESIEVDLSAGEHCFVARVWSLGEKAPFAQISVEHGFLLCPDDPELLPLLGTGIGHWEGMILPGVEWTPPASCTWAAGWRERVHGSGYAWGYEYGSGSGWHEVHLGAYGDSAEAVGGVSLQKGGAPIRRLQPALLPPMLDRYQRMKRIRHVSAFSERPVGIRPVLSADHLAHEITDWQALVDEGCDIEIPAYTKRRVIIDLEDYLCGRPHLMVSGGKGGEVSITWTEALYEHIELPEDCDCLEAHIWPKGNRDEIEGKYLICPWFRLDGPGDCFLPDGGLKREFSPLWWISGRYVQVLVETADQPLTIHHLSVRETRYPLEMEGIWESSDSRLNQLIPLMVRGLQCCAHETYMDCPFYEQLMYAGDTRLEILATYVLTKDTRLPEKALMLFNGSRLLSGLTQSRYPARVRQIIPPFSLWWIAACHDYALWRGNASLLRSFLPGIRTVSDYFAGLIGDDGLLQPPDGWNFSDWVRSWQGGVPPKSDTEPSALLNWQAAMVFRMASELEEWFGEAEIAALQKRRAMTIAKAAHRAFWNEERSLYADDLQHQHWSEHTQCLALLSDLISEETISRIGDQLFQANDLAKTTVYFRHYYFEACRKLGRGDILLNRMEEWFSMLSLGLKTPMEQPQPNRSDCHAWSSHPLFHYYATLAGIRPTKPGFAEVEIEPLTTSIEWLNLRFPHPKGDLEVSIKDGVIRVKAPADVIIRSSQKLKFD